MYISYCKSQYHSATADLRHTWLVLVRLTPAFLSTPWLAGGQPATDTQLGWLFLPHCCSLLASRPAGASSHDSSGRAAKSSKRKPFKSFPVAQLLLANCPRQVIGETWVFVYGNYSRAWIQRNLSTVATICHVYSDEREKMSTRAPVFIQPRILCHGPEVGVLTLRSLLGFLKYSSLFFPITVHYSWGSL